MLTKINILSWFFSSNCPGNSLAEVTFMITIWNIILINCLSIMGNMNSDCWMPLSAKANHIWHVCIRDMPVCWYVVLNISWHILLVGNSSDIVVTTTDWTAIWILNLIPVFINIGYGCLLSIWCVSNLNRSKTTISSYFYTINLSLTWSVAGNYWCIIFIELTCSPVAVACYFTSYFINCSGSG